MKMRALLAVLVIAVIAMTAMGTKVFAADEPVLTDDQQAGRILFNASCNYCHGERGHATTLIAKRVGKDTVPLERRTNLSPALVRHVVRHGINSMPWYRRAELSDRELDSIIAYLTRATSK